MKIGMPPSTGQLGTHQQARALHHAPRRAPRLYRHPHAYAGTHTQAASYRGSAAARTMKGATPTQAPTHTQAASYCRSGAARTMKSVMPSSVDAVKKTASLLAQTGQRTSRVRGSVGSDRTSCGGGGARGRRLGLC